MTSARPAITRVWRIAGRWRRRAAVGDIEPRLVWVFGSPRSGSTWLLRLLAEHERVLPVNEPLIGLYLGQLRADVRGVDASALDSTNFLVRSLEGGRRDHFFADEFTHVWTPALGDMMRKRFTAHAAKYSRTVSPRRVVLAIQEPNGSQAADMIMGALPRAKLVFLLRDGRDVVDSGVAANKPGAWISQVFPEMKGVPEHERLELVDRLARKWVWRTEVVQRAFEAHSGPKHLVRYEELRRDPLHQLRLLFDALGLQVGDTELNAIVEQHKFERISTEKRGAESFARSASPGSWRENLSDEEQRRMQEILGPTLRQFGYE